MTDFFLVRPIDLWPERETAKRTRSQFSATYSATNAISARRWCVVAAEFPYVWAWAVRPTPSRKGQRCRVLVRGSMNSALVEFEDGYRCVTSRNGLRRGS